MVVAAHAHRAMAMPCGRSIFERDVLQRTRFHALATMDAGIGDVIALVVSGHLAEAWIDQSALQPCRPAFGHFGKTFLFLQPRNTHLHQGIAGGDFTPCVLVGIELEARHTNVSFRHLHTETSRQ